MSESYLLSKHANQLILNDANTRKLLITYLVGIFDGARSGRPSIFTPDEKSKFKVLVDENPHQLGEAAARLQDETGKQASLFTCKRFLKKQAMFGNAVDTR